MGNRQGLEIRGTGMVSKWGIVYRGPVLGTGWGVENARTRPAPQCGAGRGILAGPRKIRKIRGRARPGVNTTWEWGSLCCHDGCGTRIGMIGNGDASMAYVI